jgi:pyruvate kinase
MLQSMTTYPVPTRAEVSDVARAIMEGADCVMLSGESASGDFPIASIKTQASIIHETEHVFDYNAAANKAYATSQKNQNDALANALAQTLILTKARLVVTFQGDHETIARLSRFRPKAPILLINDNPSYYKKYILRYGVYPYYVNSIPRTYEEKQKLALQVCKALGLKPSNIYVSVGNDDEDATTLDYLKIGTV